MIEGGRTYGWRVRELKNLRVNQVDLTQRVIRLEPGTTKNGEGREVVMTNAVHARLRACVDCKDQTDYVFTREHGKQVKDFARPGRKLARLLVCQVYCSTI